SPAPKLALSEFLLHENRYKQTQLGQPEHWKKFLVDAQRGVKERYALYEQLAKAMSPANPAAPGPLPGAVPPPTPTKARA
ncbi:MAG TPA: hypothetical protein VF341_11530, partial [Anaeromyxobacteraceae bacterium]